MPNTVIQIKRSNASATPTAGSLAAAEPAYSFNSDKLFLGNTAGTGVVEIGGKYWVDTTVAAFNRANSASGNADAIGIAGNNYTITVGAAANGWANTISATRSTASNAYAESIGTAGNNYTITVGAAANGWANTISATRSTASNAYAESIGTAANTASRDASRINIGTLAVAYGGTGISTFTQNGILFGNTAGALKVTSAGTEGQVLQALSTGVPTFAMLDGGSF